MPSLLTRCRVFFKNRKKINETKQFVLQTQRLYKRARAHLGDEIRKNIETEIANLKNALVSKDIGALETVGRRLQTLIQKHLSAYKKNPTREYIESIAFAILIALSLRAVVVEAFKIPSGSMIPTLEIGDQIFVNKFIYGVRIPFTMIKIGQFKIPDRGDVIVFIYPRNHDKDYIKRVIGLPGDTIEVRDSELYINGQLVLRRKYDGVCEFEDHDPVRDIWLREHCERYDEQLDHQFHAMILASNDAHRSPNFGPVTVTPGHLFVMGDNRDNSSDSRIWGEVPFENIKGKAMFIWWSWGANGLAINRLFRWIH